MPIISDTRLTELSSRIKHPAVAGLFYPQDPGELQQMIDQMLGQVTVDKAPPKALIAPHAGYIYSGPIAATAYATLKPVRQTIKRVVLLGPAHRVYLQGIALSRADRFATPLGMIEVDQQLRSRIAGYAQVTFNDEAFAQEHSLEVHLPFLQSVLDDFTVLPLVVGDVAANRVAEILQAVWGGDETLIVISSDLSHYHDYATARRLDQDTSRYIQALQHDKFGPDRACGSRPLHGLLQLARQQQMKIEILDVRNSGDTAGGRGRVVGYGAYAVYPATKMQEQHQSLLLDIAEASIDYGLRNNPVLLPDLHGLPAVLQAPAAVFVTLMLDGKLRGCIGTNEAVAPLAAATARYAYSAAFHDPRFPALTREEFMRTDISLSVLTEKSPLYFDSELSLLERLKPGTHGLIIAKGQRKATFLPSVWESLPQPEHFLSQLKLKAGMGPHEVPDQAWTYESHAFSRKQNAGN